MFLFADNVVKKIILKIQRKNFKLKLKLKTEFCKNFDFKLNYACLRSRFTSIDVIAAK